jgi:radical SAM protein with 4Fe4S-binding SPASM domain
MEKESHPNLLEAQKLLGWNGGGANSSGRGISNIDTQGNVHPDQFWQNIQLGNVKQTPFSKIWDGAHDPSAATLAEIRSIGMRSRTEAQSSIEGRCSRCRFFPICGGGFRTRAALMNGQLWGSDPGCYLRDEEISTSD